MGAILLGGLVRMLEFAVVLFVGVATAILSVAYLVYVIVMSISELLKDR